MSEENVQSEQVNPVQPSKAVETNKDAKTFGMLCHLLGLAGLTGIPFSNVLGPFVMWLLKKNDYAFVDDQGKEAMNFQITILIGVLICIPLFFIFVGALLLPALIVFDVIMVTVASVKANDGEKYRYPFCIRFIK